MNLKDNEYKCDRCQEIYEKSWSDEEAIAEATAIFGLPPSEWSCGQAIICDDCFTEMYPPAHPELLEKCNQLTCN